MIPYVEIINKYSLSPVSIIEPSECWFELSYYEIGEFEIYCVANDNNLTYLKNGNYVKIPNKPYIWVIKTIEYTFNSSGSKMISAKGYEAKWLLTRRIIQTPYPLPTDLATALFNLVDRNMGLNAVSYRKIIGFVAVMPTFTITIDETQATRGELWTFIQELLRNNKCGCYTTYESGQIKLRFIFGNDLSETVRFSQSLDNLISMNYEETSKDYFNYCQIVSTFNENNTSTDYVEEYPDTDDSHPFTGIDRNEKTINSNISAEYAPDPTQPDVKVKLDLTNATDLLKYQSWQRAEGRNSLAEDIIKKYFKAEINLMIFADENRL